MSSAEFHMRCSHHMSESDLQIMEKVRIDGLDTPPVHRTIERWRGFDCSLRNQLVRYRAESLQWDPAEHLRGEFGEEASLAETAGRIVNADDPLLAENLLFEVRWKFLSELERRHFMNFDFLLIYFLKLQLLEKRSLLSHPRGERAMQKARSTLSSRLSAPGAFWS